MAALMLLMDNRRWLRERAFRALAAEPGCLRPHAGHAHRNPLADGIRAWPKFVVWVAFIDGMSCAGHCKDSVHEKKQS